MAIDPALATGAVGLRRDLADESLAGLMDALVEGRPPLELLPLPLQALRLSLTLDVELRALDESGRPTPLSPGWTGVETALVVRDGSGLLHRFAGQRRLGVGRSEVVVPLSIVAPDGSPATPAAPLELVAVELGMTPPADTALAGSLRVGALRASEAAHGEAWVDVAFDPGQLGWEAVQVDVNGLPSAVPATGQLPGGVDVQPDRSLEGSGRIKYSLRPTDLPGTSRAPIPALVNELFMAATGTLPEDQIEIGEQFSTTRRIVVAGEVRGFPTIAPDQPLAILDLSSLALADYARRGRLAVPAEWWLAAPGADPDALRATLAGQPFGATEVSSRHSLLRERLADPIALGVIGALALGSAAAWLFAALGFLVSAAVATRERLSEFALLRALGLSRRQLAMSLSLENGFLLLISLGAGVMLGALLSWVVLPSVTLTSQGTPPVPQVRIALPWDVLGLLALLGGGLLTITLLVLRRLSGRVGIGALLRLGDE